MRSKPVLFSGVLVGVTVALAGCGPATGPSRLSGSWYSKGLSVRTSFPDGRVETTVHKMETRIVTINGDGSFDWTDTMLTAIGDVSHLRQHGDRVTSAVSPDVSVSVVEARYTLRSSEIEIVQALAGQEEIHIRYQVRLALLGPPRYTQTQWSSSPSRPRSIVSGRLYRSESATCSAPG